MGHTNLNWFEFAEIGEKKRQHILTTMKTHCSWKSGTDDCASCLHIRGTIKQEAIIQLSHLIKFSDLVLELLCYKC